MAAQPDITIITVESSLQYIRDTTDLNAEEKASFFRTVSRHFGSTALALSGGASFGYYHFGVVRALLDAGQLPRVIAGTSAGALSAFNISSILLSADNASATVAALICCRTDEELKVLIVPELAEKITACEDSFKVWSKRMWKTGARFDATDWARKAAFFTLGSMTFKEAYERTGR